MKKLYFSLVPRNENTFASNEIYSRTEKKMLL